MNGPEQGLSLPLAAFASCRGVPCTRRVARSGGLPRAPGAGSSRPSEAAGRPPGGSRRGNRRAVSRPQPHTRLQCRGNAESRCLCESRIPESRDDGRRMRKRRSKPPPPGRPPLATRATRCGARRTSPTNKVWPAPGNAPKRDREIRACSWTDNCPKRHNRKEKKWRTSEEKLRTRWRKNSMI